MGTTRKMSSPTVPLPTAEEIKEQPPAQQEAAEAAPEKKKKKKKKKEGRCALPGCDGRVVLLVGDCKWCNMSFCQAHRMPEGHACPGLKDCRAQAFSNNAEKVGMMKCVATKC